MGQLQQWIFGIPFEEATFDCRGFRPGAPAVREALEAAGHTFLRGYHDALADTRPGPLGRRLDQIAPAVRGFAYEGAAMALAILDVLRPWRGGLVRGFLDGPARPHVYLAHVGAGWAIARIPWRRRTVLRQLDPLLRWLAFDGFGFHHTYFYTHRTAVECRVPPRLTLYARRAFDQGLGRCLWFVECGDVGAIGAAIARFAAPRRGDLWSGVGLACAYAGGADLAALERLMTAAREYLPHLRQGVVFAAKARQRAESITPDTAAACNRLCGLSVAAAAAIADDALIDLPPDHEEPAYESWRGRIQTAVAA